MAFDIEGARQAGYSDAEIADHLAKQSKFNIGQARNAGYTDAEVIDHLANKVATVPTPPAPPAAPEKRVLQGEDLPGIGETMLIGAGRTFTRVGQGMKQAWQAVSGASDEEKAKLKAQIEEEEQLYQPLKEARPFSTGIGESLPSMVIPVGGTATAAGTVGKLALAGAIPTALEYGTPEERAKRAALGATGSVIGGYVVPKVVGAAVGAAKPALAKILGDVSPEAQATYAKAQQMGIPVTAAQLGDSKFMKYLQSAIETVPLSGGAQTKELQQQAFNRAVSRTFGEDTPTITRDVYNAARSRLGKEFDRLSGQNELKVTPALMSEVNDVISRSQHYTSPDIEKAVTNLASKMRSRLDTNTMTIPGSTYQAIDTEMANIMKAGGEKAIYVGQLQKAFRDAMDLSIKPADAAAWSTARSQYKNLKAIRDIVGKADAEGNISPALLMGRLNSTEAGKEAMARGVRGELGDIAEIGRQFITEKVPNSGTAQRALTLSALGAGSVLNPALAAKTIALSRIVNTVNKNPNTASFMMRPHPYDIGQLLAENPALATQVIGGGTGMTISDLAQR